jgi:hypothetical protein
MNAAEKTHSPFWPLLIFFGAVLMMDLQQSVKIHREKLALMQQYAQTVQLQKQAATQVKWVRDMREDLLRLAPGHPEASQIVAELHLQRQKTAAR